MFAFPLSLLPSTRLANCNGSNWNITPLVTVPLLVGQQLNLDRGSDTRAHPLQWVNQTRRAHTNGLSEHRTNSGTNYNDRVECILMSLCTGAVQHSVARWPIHRSTPLGQPISGPLHVPVARVYTPNHRTRAFIIEAPSLVRFGY